MTITHASAGADPALLDDADWLREQYLDRLHSTYEIGRLVGRAPSTIAYWLRKHGIAIRPQRISTSKESSGPWLARHYLDRDEYVTWCRTHEHEPDGDGGHGLSTSACAELAGVTRESVRRWLVQQDIVRRGSDDLSSRRREKRHAFALGSAARDALRQFKAAGVVVAVEVHSEIQVEYSTGLREGWGLEQDGGHRLRFPSSGWWTRQPCPQGAHQGLLGDSDVLPHSAVGSLPCTAKRYASLGFCEQRLLVAELVRDLTTEGWRRPEFTTDVLEEDLRAVLADGTVHAASPGYIRSQAPGRPPSGVPAGMRLALELVDWGPLARPGGVTLEQAWRDPRRVYWAIESLVRRGEDISREGIIHRMCVGRAEGLPAKAGPLWRPPAYHMALMRDVLRYDRPIVFDATPGTGTKAVAVAAMGGIYIHPSDVAIKHDGALWSPRADFRRSAEIDADDEACAEVALVDCEDVAEFERAIDRYGGSGDRIVTRLPWTEREAVLAMGARVVRVKSRPYRGDSVIAIWPK